MTVTVWVKLVGLLKIYTPDAGQAEFPVQLPAGAGVGDLVRRLEIPLEMVGTAMVNGCRLEAPEALRDGDRVLLWPPMVAGGH